MTHEAMRVKCTACHTCLSETYENGQTYPKSAYTFTICTQCGNKRCPRATDHRLECTNSNEPNQPGSRFGPIDCIGGMLNAGKMMSDKGYSIGNETDYKAFNDARNYPLENVNITRLAKANERIHNLYTIGPVQRAEVEAFVHAIIEESITVMKQHDYHGEWLGDKLKEHWGIDNEI